MKCTLLAVLLTPIIVFALAATLHLDLKSKFESLPLHEGSQKPIMDGLRSNGVYTAVITDDERWYFMVELQVGTPPETFQATLDNGWNDFFVPSIKCRTRLCLGHPRYDASKSKSSSSVGYPVQIHYSGFNTYGYASADTARVAGIAVPKQVFQEARTYLVSPYTPEIPIDTVLGLARLPVNQSDLNTISIWHNIIRQKVLRWNLFAVKLSNSPLVDGEIMFGDVNRDLFEGELMFLPVAHVNDDYDHSGDDYFDLKIKTGWQVAAHSLSFGPTIEADLAGFTIVIIMALPFMELPLELYNAILEISGVSEYPYIDCEMRHKLPEMIVRLGVAGNMSLTISPLDYIREGREEGRTYCVVPIRDHKVRDNIPKHILLGSPFLAGVYSVFDQDEKTISFAQLKRETPKGVAYTRG